MKFLKRAFGRPFREIIINIIAASPIINKSIRKSIYTLFGMKLGQVWIGGDCKFASPKMIIGDGTWINSYCIFNNSELITIGDHCDIAFGVTFVCSTHETEYKKRRAGAGICLPIKVGDGSWIGAGAIILPGVTIGEGCIIGAGALVNKDCEPNGIYAGNPARLIRRLEPLDDKM